MKVLIVDDERIICEGLSAMVPWSKYGFELPDLAFNGVHALEKMEEIRYDLLITDVRMPLMDGLSLCQKVHERYPDCTLAILSGYGDFEYAQRAIDYGVKSYLLKPVDENKLLEFLSRFQAHIREDKNIDDCSGYYACLLPFTDGDASVCFSEADCGSKMVQCLAGGETESALSCVKGFIRHLKSLMPDTGVREDMIMELLFPVFRMAEEFRIVSVSEWEQKVTQNCLCAADLSALYDRISAMTVHLSDLINERMLSGKSRASDKIAAYIRENSAGRITASGVAEHFHLSPAYCGRLFKEEQGVSILQYLHNERIACAKALLTDTDNKLEYIAAQAGYSEISSFYAQFKRIMNMTPEQFRKLSRKK